MNCYLKASISDIRSESKSGIFLLEEPWDDWFEHSTLYTLYYVDGEGEIKKIGGTKIGMFNMRDRRPNIPDECPGLNENFFSLGQDYSYYEKLNALGDDIREEILKSLKDVALDNELFKKTLTEKVMRNSLLREISPTTVYGSYHRMAMGESVLSEYNFNYLSPKFSKNSEERYELSFHVYPESNPPSNIHVLIGRNGVGKTHLINNMINSLINKEKKIYKYGKFTSDILNSNDDDIFANLISVTFSAFDETEVIPEQRNKSKGINYSYIGLKRSNEKTDLPKSPTMLKNEFFKSLKLCRKGGRDIRWKKAVKILEGDPIFKQAEVTKLIDEKDEELFKEKLFKLFNKLSSGHKIVLLTITRLVQSVEERSLILLDEPEAHLHPPLLSAFIRALSNLLVTKNGVAIIATHSPVVLQEVPRDCVWKLRRNGPIMKTERLDLESFGANIGSLTREVFGLEVSHSGFHKLISDASEKFDDYIEAKSYFENKLGDEALSILKALTLIKKI